MIPEVWSGDIILSTNDSWLAKSIRFFEKAQTGDAEFSHAAAGLGEGLLIEALWRTRINPIDKYSNQNIEIWRLPLTISDRLRFRIGMMQIAGDSYGITKIPLFAMDGIATQVSKLWGNTKPVFFFTSKFGILSIPVCSQLVIYGLHKFTNYRLRDGDHNEVPWRIVSPDYLHDLLLHPHNQAEMVHRQKVD